MGRKRALLASLLSAVMLLGATPMANAAEQSWTNITILSSGSFAPNAQGWDTSALPQFVEVSGGANLATADLNDSSLTLELDVEFTNDPTGNTGWTLLSGGTWQGGPSGRDQTSKQPAIGPYSTTTWPPMKRLRVHAIPSRNVQHVNAIVIAI